MFLDSVTAVTATEALAQSSSSFSKGFKIKQRNNVFESFVAITVQIKVSNCRTRFFIGLLSVQLLD